MVRRRKGEMATEKTGNMMLMIVAIIIIAALLGSYVFKVWKPAGASFDCENERRKMCTEAFVHGRLISAKAKYIASDCQTKAILEIPTDDTELKELCKKLVPGIPA